MFSVESLIRISVHKKTKVLDSNNSYSEF